VFPKLQLFVEKIPIGMLGLAFGLCSLGWNIEKFISLNNYLHIFSTCSALLIILLVITKLTYSEQTLAQYTSNVAIAPILPTIAMSIMIASTHFDTSIAIWIWATALLLHVSLLIRFTLTRFKHFVFESISPTWFIPTIGIVIAPLTNPLTHSLDPLNHINYWILSFAIVCYFLMLPLITLRLIIAPPLAAINKPALVLYAAPPNICLAGYLTAYPTPHMTIILLLILLSILMSIFSYYTVYRLHRAEFSPTIGAFTFPLIIGAAAMQSVSAYFSQEQINPSAVEIFHNLALAQMLLATLVTLFVCFRYFKYFSSLRVKQNA
jgi:tellurite resistance protein TehA-like permease